jgi:hypothetical protein
MTTMLSKMNSMVAQKFQSILENERALMLEQQHSSLRPEPSNDQEDALVDEGAGDDIVNAPLVSVTDVDSSKAPIIEGEGP